MEPKRTTRPTMTLLLPQTYEAARKRAFDERITVSELLRRALDLYLGQQEPANADR